VRPVPWENQDHPARPEYLETLDVQEKVERRDPPAHQAPRVGQVCLDLLVFLDFLVREVCPDCPACRD